MNIAMDALCIVFSKAFDIIEMEQIGTSERHSMRVAALCALIGRQYGYDDDAISGLVTCALFHDNALTEYNIKGHADRHQDNMRLHCTYGQRNVEWLPFAKSIDGFILYHHECETGSGPFGKLQGEFPHEAAVIAAADSVDAVNHLQRVPVRAFGALRDKISANIDRYSTREAIEALLDVLDIETLESLRDENINATVAGLFPPWKVHVEDASVKYLAGFIGHVIDCKSRFTRKHTVQIANRAWLMSGHYGYTNTERVKLYLAAALHDIGKICTPLDILEKPGALDKGEFLVIKEHVRHTYDWLGEVAGLAQIRRWASDHHEKLNASGYPFGKRAEDLDFNSRLLACLDIYQAVTEERPYHPSRSHEQAMVILYKMAGKGEIDESIVRDLDAVMAEYESRELPSPLDHSTL